MTFRLQLLKKLFSAVCEHDGAAPKIYWHLIEKDHTAPTNFWLFDEEQLIAFFAVYAFHKGQIEVTGMVHPQYRREGIFQQFLQSVKRRNPQFKKIIFACSSADDSAACMKKLGGTRDHSELALEWGAAQAHPFSERVGGKLQQATLVDLPMLVSIDAACFDSDKKETTFNFKRMLLDKNRQAYLFFDGDIPVGKIHVRFTPSADETAYLHDLCILPEFQGQGFGTKMLEHTLKGLVKSGCQRAWVEVEAKNKKALSLYQRLDFDVVKTFHYWSISV